MLREPCRGILCPGGRSNAPSRVPGKGDSRLVPGTKINPPQKKRAWVGHTQLPQPTTPTSASSGTHKAPLPGKLWAHHALLSHLNSFAAKDPEEGLESWAARNVCTRRYQQVVEQLEETRQHVKLLILSRRTSSELNLAKLGLSASWPQKHLARAS